MTIKGKLCVGVAAIALAGFLAGASRHLSAQTPAVTVGASDLGGVVTSSKGPEAGVWVIAETTDLPTKFAKVVVTDDQGRYVVPDLPKAKYKVWVRGYGLVDSPKVDGEPGKTLNLTATIAPNDSGGGGILSGHVLVRADADAGGEPVSRHRRQGQRHPRRDQDPACLDRYDQEFLPVLPRARLQGRARDPEGTRPVRRIQEFARSLGAPRAVRSGDDQHGADLRAARPGTRHRHVRGLDRPHREGRTAVRQARTPAGRRTQHRRQHVGLVGSEVLPA